MRGRIFEAVEALCKQRDQKLIAFCKAAGISPSMLYKFRAPGGPYLGRDTVTALSPLLVEIEPRVWLEAMGVPPNVDAGGVDDGVGEVESHGAVLVGGTSTVNASSRGAQ